MKERQTQRGMGMKSTGGEIVQVEGGHIVRSTGRKDRHSKVCTAKGPRDRRVRLSAQTAIQFYDVQDRLGYDRPSKAVDWLMKKAKNAIDKLAELPPWNPIPNNATTEDGQETTEQNGGGGSNEMAIVPAEQSESSGGYNFQLQDNNSAFMPSNIDTDAIAFFPTTYAASSINFQTYHPSNNYAAHDLGLSLHSFQNSTPSSDQTLFSGTNPVGFEDNYQRIVNWNNDTAAVTTASDTNRTGFMVNSAATGFLGQGSAFSQRGSLQSNFLPSLRPWNDISTASNEYHHHGHKAQPIHQASIFGSSFLSDALPGFYIPARIQGEDESHGVASDRPSSSSNSHH